MWVIQARIQRPQPYDVARAHLESISAAAGLAIYFEPLGEVVLSVRQMADDVGTATVAGLSQIESFIASIKFGLRIVSISAYRAGAPELSPDLVGLAEIAEMMKVSKPRVHQIAMQASFPRPLVKLRMGPVFTRKEVWTYVASFRASSAVPAPPP